MSTSNSIFLGFVVLLFITAGVSVVSANTLNVSPESGAGNYSSIQAALENARNGDKILVYPGIYTENVVINLPNICIMSASENPDDTIIQARDPSESVFCVFAGDSKISGLTIQGSERAGIELDSSDCHMILGNRISGNPTGILLNFSNGNTIYHNIIEENLEGITMLDSADSTVADNEIRTNAFAVTLISSENNAFSNNILEDNPAGFTLQESGDNNVVGNTINESQTAFALNLSDSNSFSGNELANATIGLMMEESRDNEITENSVITSGITVMMNSSADNRFLGNEFTDTSLGFMLEQSENNEISGNIVDTPGIAVLTTSSGANKFSENLFTNNSVGFLLQQSGENELTGNVLDSCGFGVFQNSGGNNTFSENALTNTLYGFELLDSDNNEVTGNTINVSGISLAIDSGSEINVSGNRFSNTFIGTMIAGTNNSSLSRNEFSNNMFGVAATEINKSTFENNNFSGSYSGNFSVFAPESSLENLNVYYSNKSAFLKEGGLFKEQGSFKANSLLQNGIFKANSLLNQNELLKANSLLRQNELLKANNLLQQNGIFKQTGLIKLNQVFKENGFSLEKLSSGQKDIFNENKYNQSEDADPLNNSGLTGFEGSSDEDLTFGMLLEDVNNSVLEGNRICDNYYGVILLGAQNSRLSENWLENNNFGLALDESNGSLVSDNYFNNTNNTAFSADELFEIEGTDNESNNESNLTCTWNLSKTRRLNIVGGPYVGGNYWALPNGTGFSQAQTDADKDGICDLPYHILEDGLNTDFLPLAYIPETPDNCGGNQEEKENYQNGYQGDSYQNNSSGDSSQNGSSSGSHENSSSGGSHENSSSGGSHENSSSEKSSGSGSQKYLPASSNSEGADLLQKEILAGTEVKVVFDKPKNDVSGINFKSRKYSGIVGMRIEAADVNNTYIIEEPDRKAYRHVKILIGNEVFESSENIAGGTIEFRVPKGWVKENGVYSGTISLYRLEDNGWKRLETELTGEDGDFYYFKAQTPGFSCFAITGKQQAVNAPAEQQTAIMPLEQKTENPVQSAGNEAAKGQAAAGDNKKAPGFGIILSGAGLLLVRTYFKRR
jgi:PGF-pre-PGF domain-containing protein